MTEQESPPNMSVTVPSAAEPIPSAAPASPLAAPRQPRQWLAGVAILLLIATAAGAYVYDNSRQQQQRELIHQLELRLAALQEQQPGLQENDKQRQQQILNLGTEQQHLADKQGMLEKQLLQLQSRRPNDWLLAEADYLVRMAGRKLWLEHDATAAQMLLSEADNRLRDLNDPSLLPLRQALAKDIAGLKELPQLDSEGLVLRLGALIDNVDQLTLLGLNANQNTPSTPVGAPSEDLADWRSNLGKSWHAFTDSFITIRRRDGQVEALLSPQQEWYLKENLKTRFLQAQLAIYREQQAVYEDNLTKADKWIEQYYDPNDATTQYMHSEIARLLEQAVSVSLPKQFQSQTQLEDLVRQRLQHLAAE